MTQEGSCYVSGSFTAWLNQKAVLFMTIDDGRIAMRGTIVEESPNTIRFRLFNSTDVEIYKHRIFGIEADLGVGAFFETDDPVRSIPADTFAHIDT